MLLSMPVLRQTGGWVQTYTTGISAVRLGRVVDFDDAATIYVCVLISICDIKKIYMVRIL